MTRDQFIDAVKGVSECDNERLCLVHPARDMRASAWWRTIPVYSEPAPVFGEFEAR